MLEFKYHVSLLKSAHLFSEQTCSLESYPKPPPNFEAIQHLVIDQYQGEQKPELMLVPQESRQEMWLPLTCFDIFTPGQEWVFLD